MFKIVIIRKEEKPLNDVNSELQWLSDSLGMFNERDKESSCFRIFIELVKEKKPLKSDDIAFNSRLSRGTVVFHLNKLMESGLVVNENNRYKLRNKDLSILVRKVKKDVLQTFKEIEEITKDLERKLN